MASILLKDIKIEGKIMFSGITTLKIQERVNDHAKAYIAGILHEKMNEKDVYGLNLNSNIRIKATIGLEDEIIFAGVPVDLEMKSISGVKHLKMALKSHSFKLDIKKNSRSFQDINNPYRSIFTQIVEFEYGGIILDTASNGRTQGQFILQYKETDWQLLKRLASQLNAIIFPHMEANKPQIGIGTPRGRSHTENSQQFEMDRMIGTHMVNASNFSGWAELDFVSELIESNRIYKLCDVVIHNDVKFLVFEKISELRHGVIINLYRLQPLDSFKQNILFNESLTGLSINGRVLTVEGDKVRLHLSIDQYQNIEYAYWFDFDTPYVAEKHRGEFVMPEKGTQVQLYCPDKDERNAYISQVLRQDGERNSKTGNPSTKYFETINGKELKLSPDSLSLTARHGNVYMQMTESGGISFVSRGDLLIKGSTIEMHGQEICANAGDKINIETGGSSITVDTEINIDGIAGVDF